MATIILAIAVVCLAISTILMQKRIDALERKVLSK